MNNRSFFLIVLGAGQNVSLVGSDKSPRLVANSKHCFHMMESTASNLCHDSYKDSSLIYDSSKLIMSSNPSQLQKALLLIPSHWGMGFQHMYFNIYSITLYLSDTPPNTTFKVLNTFLLSCIPSHNFSFMRKWMYNMFQYGFYQSSWLYLKISPSSHRA